MSDNARLLSDTVKICRTCLKQKPLEELRSLLHVDLKAIVCEVFNIELVFGPALPTSICQECFKQVIDAEAFYKQLISVEKQFKCFLSVEPREVSVVALIDNNCELPANIEQIIEPDTELKDNLIFLEEPKKDAHSNPLKDILETTFAVIEDTLNDNATSSISYLDDGNNSNGNFDGDNEALNLSKGFGLTNVIRWANSEESLNRSEPQIKLESDVGEEKPQCNFQQDTIKTERIVNYSCDLCSKTFRFQFIYKKHLLKHGMALCCDVCLLEFNEVNRYFAHIKDEHKDFKPYDCPKCDQKFYTLTPLKMHYNIHLTLPRKFECDLCGKTFYKQYSLTFHKKKIHLKIDPYECEICHKKLAGAHSLRNHLKIHKGEKRHKCDLCGASFIHRFSLRAHLRTHTGEKPFVCQACDRTFSSSSYLKIHMRTHTEEKPYVCPECSKPFKSRCALVAHEKSHTGEKKFQCDVCGWRSNRSADLRGHIRKHTGERPYKCNQCDKSYRTASNLAVHRRTHLGLREHVCNICGRAFGDPRTLKSHIRIHTGETPYQCHICGYRFRQSGQLSAHRKTHRTN